MLTRLYRGKYATLVRELSEFGDTVGVLDAHQALTRRKVPFHFDVFQTMLHHFARIGDLDQCLKLLHGTIRASKGESKAAVKEEPKKEDAEPPKAGAEPPKAGAEPTKEDAEPAKDGIEPKKEGKVQSSSRVPRKMLYNALLLALIENKMWEWCDQVLAEMVKENVAWDEATCLLVARLRLESGNPGQMKEVLKQAKDRGVANLTSAVYNYVLTHTTEENEKKAIEEEMKEKRVAVADVSRHPLLSAAAAEAAHGKKERYTLPPPSF